MATIKNLCREIVLGLPMEKRGDLAYLYGLTNLHQTDFGCGADTICKANGLVSTPTARLLTTILDTPPDVVTVAFTTCHHRSLLRMLAADIERKMEESPLNPQELLEVGLLNLGLSIVKRAHPFVFAALIETLSQSSTDKWLIEKNIIKHD